MVGDSANSAKKALTIAVRYAAIRRQFSSGKGKVSQLVITSEVKLNNQLETQILDYPIHQRRLMVSSLSFGRSEADIQPLLAQSIAMGFTGLKLQTMYEVN